MVKQLLKRTFVYDLWRYYKGYNKPKNEVSPDTDSIWVNTGRPVPPPHFVKIETIKHYASLHKLNTFIETGTYLGETTFACLDTFENLITIELDEKLFRDATALFKNYNKVKLYKGDSGDVLSKIVPQLTNSCLFWLDGHYSMGITAKGTLNTPILKELQHIFGSSINHTILIDDARCFTGEDDYPTIESLRDFVFGYNKDLVFTVMDDIIRIHHVSFPDSDNVPLNIGRRLRNEM